MYENVFYIMTVSRATVRALVENSVYIYITNHGYPPYLKNYSAWNGDACKIILPGIVVNV